MDEFNVGDEVILLENYDGANIRGLTATIAKIKKDSYTPYLVEFSQETIDSMDYEITVEYFHDGDIGDRVDRRWWVPAKSIALVGPSGETPVIRKIRKMEAKRKSLGYRW